ncbi:hypothetical protein Efla_001057 [Eimeria flavescens]
MLFAASRRCPPLLLRALRSLGGPPSLSRPLVSGGPPGGPGTESGPNVLVPAACCSLPCLQSASRDAAACSCTYTPKPGGPPPCGGPPPLAGGHLEEGFGWRGAVINPPACTFSRTGLEGPLRLSASRGAPKKKGGGPSPGAGGGVPPGGSGNAAAGGGAEHVFNIYKEVKEDHELLPDDCYPAWLWRLAAKPKTYGELAATFLASSVRVHLTLVVSVGFTGRRKFN